MYRIGRWIVPSGLLLILISSIGLTEDWPCWRGPDRDGKVKGFVAPQAWPSGLKCQWKVTVGLGDATPALVADRLYCFTRQEANEVLTCLNASDGKVIWKDAYKAVAVTGAASRHPGPRSSPAVAAGKVVTLGVGGVLSCIDAQTGKVVWRKDIFPNVVPRFFTGTSPLITDGLVITQLGGEGNGGVVALDLVTGEQRWLWSQEGPSYSSPVLMTADGLKQVVMMTEASVVGLAIADGQLIWRIPFKPERMAYNASTPIVDGQTVYVAGSGRGTKAFKIERKGEGFTATELWSCDTAPQFCSAVLKDGYLFGISDRGNIYCIDAKTGTLAWMDQTNRRNFGAMLDIGPCLVLLPEGGELLVFRPDPKGYNELAKYKVADGQTYAHPVLSGNRIFVKDTDSLSLWTL